MIRIALVFTLVAAQVPAQIAQFRVRETAGLRRFSYPARARIAANSASLRLLENGKPVPAQFTAVDGGIEIDFNVSLGPWETRDYRVETGSPEMGQGISMEESGGGFTVRSSSLAVSVPGKLQGLLAHVKGAGQEYLRPGSRGLVLNDKNGGVAIGGAGAKAAVLKRGPLVCALRFESEDTAGGGRAVKSVVDMEFPRSKSWVEVRWKILGPEGSVESLAADLNLWMEGARTLVDFGANDTVYDALQAGQRLILAAAPPGGGGGQPRRDRWFVHLDDALYASGAQSAEGWAHIMDRQRAVAVAVEGFGRETRDSIEASAAGRLIVRREFDGAGDRSLHFWIHFVTMPVQIGAATSPQAMENPLRVELLP